MPEEQSVLGQELPPPLFPLQKISDEPVNYAKKIYHLLVGIVLVIVAINIIVFGGWAYIYFQAQDAASKAAQTAQFNLYTNCFLRMRNAGESSDQAYKDCPKPFDTPGQ